MQTILPIPDDDHTQPIRIMDDYAAPLMNRLRVVLDTSDETLDLLVARNLIIGRNASGESLLNLSSYGGREHGVSRQHARLDYRGGRWFITDLESQNGTRLNGLLLYPLVTTEIRSGSRLHLGSLGLYLYFG